MMKHETLRWNDATQEWFCTRCGHTSNRVSECDAQLELDQHECRLPSVDVLKFYRRHENGS